MAPGLFTHGTLSRSIALLALLAAAPAAHAAMTWQIMQAQPRAGETVELRSILFNDTPNALTRNVPEQVSLTWRGASGETFTTQAERIKGGGNVTVPVNNFVAFNWQTTVPAGARGLLAMSVQGEPATTPIAVRVAAPAFNAPVASAHAPTPSGATPSAVATPAGAAPPSAATPPGKLPARTAADARPSVSASAFENFRNAISSFEPIYFDFGDYGGANARFQLSFKYRLFTPQDPKNPGFLDNLYLGYTQTSLWDLHDKSVPFVDTTYNPSVFWHEDALWQSASQRWFTGLSAGVEHKSNGKGGDDSRSLNDAFVEPRLNYRLDDGSTLTVAPRIKNYFAYGENPDYPSYLGYVDWKLRWAQDNGLVLDGLYQQGHHGRHAIQVGAAWPLQRTFLHMNGYLHVQLYQGYGETLLGYNHKVGPQVRIGLSLVP